MKTLKCENNEGILTITINRPDVRNAFNEDLIDELLDVFEKQKTDTTARVIILRGEGNVFCAGGDLNWMKKSIDLSPAENLADTTKLTHMFDTMNSCPKPVVGLIHGAAIGGGVGLVSVCDYLVAEKHTVFSLSEVRLGIIPACIGPFVLAKIGETHARALFISAERFTAHRAYEIGLVHEVAVDMTALEAAGKRIAQNLLQCGPNAITAAKKLIKSLKSKPHDEALKFAAGMLADLRITPEAQEGLRAFLEKRKPSWIHDETN